MRFPSFTCTFTECCRNIAYTVTSDKTTSKEHPWFGPVTVSDQALMQITWVDVSKAGSSIAFIKGVNEHGNEAFSSEFNITAVQSLSSQAPNMAPFFEKEPFSSEFNITAVQSLSSQAPNMAPFFEKELEGWIINLTKSVGENMTYQLPATYDTNPEDTVTIGVLGNHSNVWLNA
jgi:hypothetical protein